MGAEVRTKEKAAKRKAHAAWKTAERHTKLRMKEVREAYWKASNKKFPSFKMPAARTATRFAKDAAELASKAAQKQADKVLGIHGHSKAKKAEPLTLLAQEAEDAAM